MGKKRHLSDTPSTSLRAGSQTPGPNAASVHSPFIISLLVVERFAYQRPNLTSVRVLVLLSGQRVPNGRIAAGDGTLTPLPEASCEAASILACRVPKRDSSGVVDSPTLAYYRNLDLAGVG